MKLSRRHCDEGSATASGKYARWVEKFTDKFRIGFLSPQTEAFPEEKLRM